MIKVDRNWREMIYERRSYISFIFEGIFKLVYKLEFYWVEESKEGDFIMERKREGRVLNFI